MDGIGVDPETGLASVNDRNNRRVHIFRADGDVLDQLSYGKAPTSGDRLSGWWL